MIRLYKDPGSSEVAEEYPSLHEAFSDVSCPPSEAQLIDNGVTLAFEHRYLWTLTSSGVRALVAEHVGQVRALAAEVSP